MGSEDSRTYEPGLDGLRAVAVAAVLLFHSGYGWAKGGFLGVSVFFTLSGFLITGALLAEVERSRRVRLREFWVRRARRLLPASLLTLLAVAAMLPWFESADGGASFRGDIVAALAHVANWRFVLDEQSYAELFTTGPSPVLHFWSLAVEEQFYVVVPLVISLAAGAARRWNLRWLPAGSLFVLLGASLAAVLLTNSIDLGYYGTHTRAAEFLVGAVAAWALQRMRRHPRRAVRGLRHLPTAVGGAALIALTGAVVVVDQTDPWLYRGGFALLALVWCGLLVGALGPGPVRTVLSLAPLRRLGELSYGVYLFHWPVFLLLTEQRVGVDGVMLLATRLAVTMSLTLVSYVFVEQPVRRRRWSFGAGRGWAAVTLTTALVVGVAVLRTGEPDSLAVNPMVTAPDEVVRFDDPGTTGPGSESQGPVVDSGSSQPELPEEPEPAEVVVIGSPVEQPGLAAAVSAARPPARLIDLTEPGCGTFLAASPACSSPEVRLRDYLAARPMPAAVVLSVSRADHAAIEGRILEAGSVSEAARIEYLERIEEETMVVDRVRATVGSGPLLIVLDDGSGASAALASQLEIATLRTENASRSSSAEVAVLIDRALAEMESAQPVERLRVMVVGDSTSYGVAAELDRRVGELMSIVWAGRRNCPLAPVVEVRWWAGAQWTLEECLALQEQWPSIAAEQQPHVLIVAVSLPEHSDQRYAGDERWYGAGDARFALEHDQAVERLIGMLPPDSTVLFADSAYADSSQPARVDAWNELVATWAVRWPQISIVPLGAWVRDAEAAAGRSLRPDAIHLDDATLARAVDELFLPVLMRIRDEMPDS